MWGSLRFKKWTRTQKFTKKSDRTETDLPYLIYTENMSKNNSGGLSHRKVEPKQIVHHCNKDNPKRCLVNLYHIYLHHCPSTAKTAFYLTPLKKPKDICWYSEVPVGNNTLSQTVRRLCTSAGIKGYKTNHSLRVTSATRMFQGGVDEQLIMSRTGHRSIEGVRSRNHHHHYYNLLLLLLLQWNPSYLDSVGPRGARIFETARNFESS